MASPAHPCFLESWGEWRNQSCEGRNPLTRIPCQLKRPRRLAPANQPHGFRFWWRSRCLGAEGTWRSEGTMTGLSSKRHYPLSEAKGPRRHEAAPWRPPTQQALPRRPFLQFVTVASPVFSRRRTPPRALSAGASFTVPRARSSGDSGGRPFVCRLARARIDPRKRAWAWARSRRTWLPSRAFNRREFPSAPRHHEGRPPRPGRAGCPTPGVPPPPAALGRQGSAAPECPEPASPPGRHAPTRPRVA
jgi:hypothetical protein